MENNPLYLTLKKEPSSTLNALINVMANTCLVESIQFDNIVYRVESFEQIILFSQAIIKQRNTY
jgi:hypothetical protein